MCTFAPGCGVAEDPVCGSMNASVGQWFTSTGGAPATYRVSQGTRVGRSGTIEITADVGGTVWSAGLPPATSAAPSPSDRGGDPASRHQPRCAGLSSIRPRLSGCQGRCATSRPRCFRGRPGTRPHPSGRQGERRPLRAQAAGLFMRIRVC
ncbi:PhzF family phenazine biosynthesis protein [Streptomyces fructofermentans]|nr:PhzF family phenazine biosynthesis protein [Streptomyces fructofermentans]